LRRLEFELVTKPSKSDFYEFIKLDDIGIFIRMLCNLSISFGVLNNHIDLPTDNKMEPVWNSHLSEPTLSCLAITGGAKRTSVHPEMVDFGFRQGPSEFSTAPVRSAGPTGQAGIARYFED
jgi:hypothetical protein